jgi:MraZ protein
MQLFLSTYINKIDKKGRVSIPAPFRGVIAAQSFSSIIVYSSLINECVEACSIERIKYLNDNINKLDPYSHERDAFATLILGGSVELSFDPEGRVVLPEELIEFASLQEQACFVGKGATFEIWQVDKFKDYAEKLRQDAKANRYLLGGGQS